MNRAVNVVSLLWCTVCKESFPTPLMASMLSCMLLKDDAFPCVSVLRVNFRKMQFFGVDNRGLARDIV